MSRASDGVSEGLIGASGGGEGSGWSEFVKTLSFVQLTWLGIHRLLSVAITTTFAGIISSVHGGGLSIATTATAAAFAGIASSVHGGWLLVARTKSVRDADEAGHKDKAGLSEHHLGELRKFDVGEQKGGKR